MQLETYHSHFLGVKSSSFKNPVALLTTRQSARLLLSWKSVNTVACMGNRDLRLWNSVSDHPPRTIKCFLHVFKSNGNPWPQNIWQKWPLQLTCETKYPVMVPLRKTNNCFSPAIFLCSCISRKSRNYLVAQQVKNLRNKNQGVL
jgi:hypothetical protein